MRRIKVSVFHTCKADGSCTYRFLLSCSLLFCAFLAVNAQQTGLTAAQVIEKIRQNSGIPWSSSTVDVIKAGNPETKVTGIVTTMFATYDILKEAVAKGCNLIITHEPTFYNHLDDTAGLKSARDKVYADKRKFIESHHLVI